MSNCLFGCNKGESSLTEIGSKRLQTVIESSKQRGDDLHLILESADNKKEFYCHKDCISTYTSKFHIKHSLKRRGKDIIDLPSPPKRSRRSSSDCFDFLSKCIFCGDKCDIKPDPKHPNRWKKACLCRTADRGNIKTFKDKILDICQTRADTESRQIQTRLHGALSDLHAADARYHTSCYSNFMKPCYSGTSSSVGSSDDSTNTALNKLVETIMSDKTKMWISTELFDEYESYEGITLSKKRLMDEITKTLGNEYVMLSSIGFCNILIHKTAAHGLLNLQCTDKDDIGIHTSILASKIAKECKGNAPLKGKYRVRIDKEVAYDSVSDTLQELLEATSSKLKYPSLPALLIGNIMTSIVTNTYTPLQVALGVMLRDKKFIEALHEYNVCCSYDEMLRFKSSAAASACLSSKRQGIFKNGSLIQAISDNFDANISSQNGQKTTHSLALLLVQNGDQYNRDMDARDVTIRKLKKHEMSNPVCPDVPPQMYEGPKKPPMPQTTAVKQVHPLKLLCEQNISVRHAQNKDIAFLKDVLSEDTPEFGGYNTKLSRDQGQTLQPGTKASYQPLIDMKPADPSSMMTMMVEAQRLTQDCEQSFTVSTNDQQLYKIAVHVQWFYPTLFPRFINRLGGMHMLMSFIGCVGSLMAESGLEDILSCAFAGVPKMLSGKNYPQNFRALRMITEELLRNYLQHLDSYDLLIDILEKKSAASPTSKQWVENLIKPVLIMMMFTRAEREGDWLLHLWAVKAMLPYFFAARHFNYAKYGLLYYREMEKLPQPLLAQFLKGEHVTRHHSGIWNGIWTDMLIETTFMRYGHGPSGIIGITLKPSALKRWALSLHICCQLTKDLADMSEEGISTSVEVHKEEGYARIRSDNGDKEKLKKKLESCIDPFDCDSHHGNLVNVVTGRIFPSDFNVHDSVKLGSDQMTKFENGWPENFHDSLTSNVVCMDKGKKNIEINKIPIYDTELVYSRVLGLILNRTIDLKAVLSHELAPIPTSMFADSGEMRIGKSKSTLKRKLQIETSSRGIHGDVQILDGCALLWTVYWPASGTVQDFASSFSSSVCRRLRESDVYLIFDRYHEFSIKTGTRTARKQGASRVHQLSMNTVLPAQNVALTVTENKLQLIHHITEYLIRMTSDRGFTNRLVVTSKDATPVEVTNGQVIQRHDLKNNHEEADVIIVHQMLAAAANGARNISIICDDTDVFLLLSYFYSKHNLTINLIMEPTSAGRTVTDIKKTAETHDMILGSVLAAHALSGCDTTSTLFGIGKLTVLKAITSGHSLDQMGQEDADMNDVIKEATNFMAHCYGIKLSSDKDMSAVRFDVWTKKNAKKSMSSAPKLRQLPPTTEAFHAHVKRAHFQTMIWKCADKQDPPNAEATEFGWEMDIPSKTLLPVAVPANIPCAPPEVLKLIKCACSKENACATGRCTCLGANLSCTVFCQCKGDARCNNPQTRTAQLDEVGDTDQDLEEFLDLLDNEVDNDETQ